MQTLQAVPVFSKAAPQPPSHGCDLPRTASDGSGLQPVTACGGCADLPRLPSVCSPSTGVKRSRGSAFSAFEPFPLGGPAGAVMAERTKRARAAAASPVSSDSSGSALVTTSCGGDVADSAAVHATARAAVNIELLRLTARVLPRMSPVAAAGLLLRLRAVIRAGAAQARAPVGSTPPSPVRRSAPRPSGRPPRPNRQVFAEGMAYIESRLPTHDVTALRSARAFLAALP